MRQGELILCLHPIMKGSVAYWEEWAGIRFPESGGYVVPGALQPTTTDRKLNEGRYADPNVWMCHYVRVTGSCALGTGYRLGICIRWSGR